MNREKVLILLLFLISMWYNGKPAKATTSIDTVQMRAIMYVHADVTNFSISIEYSSFEKIIENYSSTVLQLKGLRDCIIFKITSISPICKCDYVIAYNFSDKNFYRLSGFRNNDFSDFFNHVLLGGGNVPSTKKATLKKMKDNIFHNVAIEGYDLNRAYQDYYRKCENAMYDTTSCYRKSVIRAY